MTRQRSKRELMQTIRPRCLKAYKSGKTRILDEIVATASYQRKYTNQLPKNGPGNKGSKKMEHQSQTRISNNASNGSTMSKKTQKTIHN